MTLTTNAVLVHDLENIEIFPISVNDNNYIKVRKKLEFEKYVIVCILKQMKDRGEIKSIWRPRNKKMQSTLDNIVKAKRTIDKSIDKIKELFYRNK